MNNEIHILSRPGCRIPSEYFENRNFGIAIRTRPKIPFFMVASEKEVLYCLKGSGGRMDYSTAFLSSEPSVLEWSEELFDHYWVRGKSITL
jgi:predicted transcriptional regulator